MNEKHNNIYNNNNNDNNNNINMATLVNNNNDNDNATTFSLVGTREMLTAETTTKYFATIKNPETINKIIFSTKSFDVDSAKIA